MYLTHLIACSKYEYLETDKGLYYEFLCLEQAGEKAHARFNKGEVIWANIRSEEERFFKIMKYVKNADMCDMTIFNSAKTKYYKK